VRIALLHVLDGQTCERMATSNLANLWVSHFLKGNV